MIGKLYNTVMAQTSASKPYLLGKGQVLSYGDVDATVRKLTSVFQDRGLREGDYVFLNVKDDSQLAVIYLACIVNGLAAVVTDPSMPSLNGSLKLVKPKLAFVDRGKLKTTALKPDLHVIPVDEPRRKTRGVFKKLLKKNIQSEAQTVDLDSFPGLLDKTLPFEADFPVVHPQTTALVLFTSGTTSEPKGVELTQNNIAVQMRILLKQFRLDDRADVFNILPLHHTDGITNGLMLTFFAGAALHRPGQFTIHDLPNSLDYIFREGISHLITVPTVLALIQRLGDDFTDVFQSGDFKVLVTSAGALSPDLWQSFEARFRTRVSNCYGLTETVTLFSCSGPDDDSYEIGTVGKPLDGEVRLVDDAGLDVTADKAGEILVRSELVMKGYINNPQATAAAIKDGWFHTGDIGRITTDGKIELRGRKKSIINRGGINIHPGEITDAVLEHPAVIYATVFGEPDDIWGETAVLCIVEDPAISLSDQELQAFLESRLSNEKMPGEFHRFADFPRGPAGKVILAELCEQVALRRQSRRLSHEGDTFEVVLDIAATMLRLPRETLSRSSSAESVSGWDSLFHLNFIMAVEETYSIQFQPREIMTIQTLGDLVDLAQSYRKSNKAAR